MSVATTTVTDMSSSQHDFDFIFGRWSVRNRKLVDVTDPTCESGSSSTRAATARRS